MKRYSSLFIGLFLMVSAGSGCDTTEVEVFPILIVPGQGIDGVKIGDSRERVESILGEPSYGGLVDGSDRAWFSAEYAQGDHAGLRVYFLEIDNNPGPVDLLTVQFPYLGKTKEGIGIGSLRRVVQQTYGIPERTIVRLSDHWTADFYCFQRRKLEIHYTDSLVIAMSIGYYLPTGQIETNPCE